MLCELVGGVRRVVVAAAELVRMHKAHTFTLDYYVGGIVRVHERTLYTPMMSPLLPTFVCGACVRLPVTSVNTMAN